MTIIRHPLEILTWHLFHSYKHYFNNDDVQKVIEGIHALNRTNGEAGNPRWNYLCLSEDVCHAFG